MSCFGGFVWENGCSRNGGSTYMKENIWGPLGADSFTFFPDQDPAIAARHVPMSFREDPNGPAVEKSGAQTVTTGAK